MRLREGAAAGMPPWEDGWKFRANPVTVKLTNGQRPLRKREGVREDEAKPGDLDACFAPEVGNAGRVRPAGSSFFGAARFS